MDATRQRSVGFQVELILQRAAISCVLVQHGKPAGNKSRPQKEPKPFGVQLKLTRNPKDYW